MTFQNRVSIRRIALVLCCSWPVSACTELQVSSPSADGGPSGGVVVESGGDGPSGGTGGTVVDTGGTGVTGGNGATGGAQVTGGALAGTGGDSTTACAAEGAMRCSASSPVNREVCGGGEWLASTACAMDEVCDGVDAACPSLDSFCMGNAGQHVCAGTVMHLCSDKGLSVSQMDCGDARLCQDGLSSGECAFCLTEEDFTCDAANLSECRADGSGFEWSETCATAALCNPLVGGCTTAACTAGSYVCEGDLLRSCNDTQTGFEDVRICLADLCDGVAGSCDVCVRGEKACLGGEPATCNQEGSDWIPGSCPAGAPLCTGQGSCVACRSAANCLEWEGPCQVPYCDLATGECGSTIATDEPCTQGSGSPGFCSKVGGCVECRTPSDCGSFQACDGGSCKRAPRCGDGFLDRDLGELCDDGNNQADDNCSADCTELTPYRINCDPSGAGTLGMGFCLISCDQDTECPRTPTAETGQLMDDLWKPVCAIPEWNLAVCFIECDALGSCPTGYECVNPGGFTYGICGPAGS